jgi:hypothetical protein
MLEKIAMMMITANGCDEALQNRLSNNSFDDDD